MVSLFEGLQGCHEVVTTSYSGCDDTLRDTSRYRAFNDSCDRVHGADDFGLELWGDMELDLLEEVFGCAKTANDKDILKDD